MEHDWGRNVTEFGLGDLGATMAAIYPFPPAIYLTNREFGPDAFIGTQQVPTDTSPRISFYPYPKMPGHPHFPYGWAVTPDAPV